MTHPFAVFVQYLRGGVIDAWCDRDTLTAVGVVMPGVEGQLSDRYRARGHHSEIQSCLSHSRYLPRAKCHYSLTMRRIYAMSGSEYESKDDITTWAEDCPRLRQNATIRTLATVENNEARDTKQQIEDGIANR
jgi:hypothetical protein